MAAISIAFYRGTRCVRFFAADRNGRNGYSDKKYFYTIAGEIEKLLQNGDEPQLEKLLPEVLKYFPEPQRTYCAMVHSLHDCLARTELIIARINEELGEITNVAQLALFDYYINSGKLKSYCKRHES